MGTTKMEAERQRYKMLELRLKGKTYRQIGEKLGCTAQNVHKEIQQAFKERPIENIEEVRQLELDRLDRMIEPLEDNVNRGDVRHVEAMLKLMDRRAKLLGLNAPERLEIAGELDPKVIVQTTIERLVKNNEWRSLLISELGREGHIENKLIVEDGKLTYSKEKPKLLQPKKKKKKRYTE